MSETYDCGHGCSITCPAGGGCLYDHETGHCYTFCNSTAGVLELKSKLRPQPVDPEKRASQKFDVSMKAVTPDALKRLFIELGFI